MLSEEDEGNLMEFLRASGHDNNRERKSWGSLGNTKNFRFWFNTGENFILILLDIQTALGQEGQGVVVLGNVQLCWEQTLVQIGKDHPLLHL